MPEAKQNSSKLAEMFARASIFTALVGIAVDVVRLSMALLSFRGFDTPSLPAQGEQRRSSFFNIRRDIPVLFFANRLLSTQALVAQAREGALPARHHCHR